MLVKVETLKKGDKINLVRGEEVVVTELKAGDHSPFGKARPGSFWHPRPFTVYYKDANEEKGMAVEAATSFVNVLNRKIVD